MSGTEGMDAGCGECPNCTGAVSALDEFEAGVRALAVDLGLDVVVAAACVKERGTRYVIGGACPTPTAVELLAGISLSAQLADEVRETVDGMLGL